MDTMLLPVKLTDKELLERGTKLAELSYQMGKVDDEKKSSMSSFKAQLDTLEEEAKDVARELRSKTAYRAVEVISRKDYKRAVEETIRQDTREIVNTRPLTPAELQLELELKGKKKKEEKPAAKPAEKKEGKLVPMEGGKKAEVK